MTYSSEKSASSWLTTLPLRESGFNLTKGAFQDNIHFRYGWQLKYLPSSCACRSSNSVEHALSCPNGGHAIHRHNDIRVTIAALMAEVCREVPMEPDFNPPQVKSSSIDQPPNADEDA